MARQQSLSGFPEYLPQERLVELSMIEALRRTFERHGFANIETRAVETVKQLVRKGEIDKEIYAVSRLQADAAESESADRQLALHYDLTLPFSRYVSDNAGYLTFPFRRYQIQKVWRGERPQEGRFREFLQADIDVVGDGSLPFRYDVELALVILEALGTLPIPKVRMHVNNRKLAQGYYQGIGIQDTAGVLRNIDKLEKVGPERVREALIEELGITGEQAERALALATIRTSDTGFVQQVRALDVENPLLEQGLQELSEVVDTANQERPGRLLADLSIARGLDYYTGTVFETFLEGHEDLGSIASGGRYESLARKGNRVFPGVGASIGVSRVLARVLASGLASASRSVPTAVLVALNDDEQWLAARSLAAQLRSRDIAVEVAAVPAKFGKQIKYAENRGIPFVWFIDQEGSHEVKDIRTGEQKSADPENWMPPLEDRAPLISAVKEEKDTVN